MMENDSSVMNVMIQAADKKMSFSVGKKVMICHVVWNSEIDKTKISLILDRDKST